MEKEVIVLVGAQGSGKSTLAKTLGGCYYAIISRDDMGDKLHREEFKYHLKNGTPRIIVDKINQTINKRAEWLLPAKQAGYVTTIIDITEHPSVCFERMKKRRGHPTIKHDDTTTMLRALYTFYSQYEKPQEFEADNINYDANFNPNFIDLTDEIGDQKYLIVGDIHGCFSELTSLMLQSGTMHEGLVVALGDLVDRGPDVDIVLDMFMSSSKMYSVMGNHDNKLLRYLIGNKVYITSGLRKTLDQIGHMHRDKVAIYLMGLPKMIKVGGNYMFHAGLNPTKHIEKQSPHTLMYARKFNPENGSYEDTPGSKHWWEFIDEASNKEHRYSRRFFGHDYHPDVHVAYNTYALDGHCCFGGELRGMIMPERKLITIKAAQTYADRANAYSVHDSLRDYQDMAESGYLREVCKEDLILYKYSEKCVYEKNWNEITRNARGHLFNRKTGDRVAVPFSKFFNYGEMSETEHENLPVGSEYDYEIFDKMDGSLGILYWIGDEPFITTCGGFESPQGLKATQIFREKYYKGKEDEWRKWKSWTFLFEIIYPENRIVCDYGDREELVLLSSICMNTLLEFSYKGLVAISDRFNVPLVKKIDSMTLYQALKQKESMPALQEGYVVRFFSKSSPNRTLLRMKIKGDEYCRVHRIVTNMSPLSVWENMKDGQVSVDFLQSIPEEFTKDAEYLADSLVRSYQCKLEEARKEYAQALKNINKTGNPMFQSVSRKDLGLYVRNSKSKYGSLFFFFLDNNSDAVDVLIMNMIRPHGNKQKE